MMEAYFAERIEARKLNYTKVVERYSKYKEGIDQILAADGYTVDGDGWASKDEA